MHQLFGRNIVLQMEESALNLSQSDFIFYYYLINICITGFVSILLIFFVSKHSEFCGPADHFFHLLNDFAGIITTKLRDNRSG